ncbi:hypothetical protein Tco_1113824 [Tanacetum coccineum]|uniref:Uncharacterized protein n=1 Tax=Tanacetum coccineum TaxID=301880 RepID=A0ABQ5IUF9_9ASTR
MEFYVNEQTKGTIDDLDEYNEPCEENSKKTCSDLFFKPYLDAQDGKDIYELIERDYSLIPIPTHRDISNPDELCKTKEFTIDAIRRILGFGIRRPCCKEIDDIVYSEKEILCLPTKGHCSFTANWSLDSLALSTPSRGPYRINPPSPDLIKAYIQLDRLEPLTRVHKGSWYASWKKTEECTKIWNLNEDVNSNSKLPDTCPLFWP